MGGRTSETVLVVALCVVLAAAPGAMGAQTTVDQGPGSGVAAAQDPPGLGFNVTVGGPNTDRFDAVIRSGDGGYVAAGTFGATETEGSGTAWLVKFDADGNVVWNRTYDTGQLKGVVRADDGGYLAVGTRPDPEGPESVGIAVKVGPDGTQEWFETYGEYSEWASFEDVANAGDDGFVLMGTSFLGPQRSPNQRAGNGYFVKVDADGTVEWERGYGTETGADNVANIHRTDAGTFRFFGGIRGFQGSSASPEWAGTVSADGALLDNRTFSLGDTNVAASTQTADGYALVGVSGLVRGTNVEVATTDGDLNVVSNWTIRTPNNVTATGITATPDGGYAVSIWNWSGDSFQSATVTGAVMKVSSDGTKQWVQDYGFPNVSFANGVTTSDDGGIVVVGTSPTREDGAQGWIAKTGPTDGEDGGPASPAEAIAGEDGVVQTSELQEAIQLWATGDPVPGTDGETIDTETLQEIITLWATEGTVGG